MSEAFLPVLEKVGIVAILRNVPAGSVRETARALYDGGVSVMEVTMNTPGAPDIIRELKEEWDDRMHVGAGTVLDLEDADRAREAGAAFFITPNLDVEVLRFATENAIPVIPGAMTPTEVVKAHREGAVMVKVFPGGSLGPAYIKDLRGPLPHIPLMAVGGVDETNAADFLRAGARALGIGSSLVDPRRIAAGDFGTIRERAARLRAIVDGFAGDSLSK
ncbi:2-dehydro-3-deoxyphosphogluconate aldolase/(4S)-4-hydroxy-2-oxoglutarate aldolase [Melghirimyces profundicolus]|uniref:2-dehydro-3-deoxyphosphogluconate aldolase/(4S)-4-hydroxy-2-oxoglutarate aldolase n=1 Tax=Melghirimyces profundicolus TaxID=1242148 RepID=A0A2T6C4V7_9BACL|nr:bifunctional 4-hydroxy-2-oxoglutarate aldolase/2-dehydro-3-deoxy-phosphogluconate aldolase [Melghirimyces profundicolus]PTX63359.1 2-dehydro-3-deoxyphosphogluconate aldolase/(4S)-4-hydroxy-2-oxoglutarate aldolase [Melghirimyces profundicolus]